MADFHHSETDCPHFTSSLLQPDKIDVIIKRGHSWTDVTLCQVTPKPMLFFKLKFENLRSWGILAPN